MSKPKLLFVSRTWPALTGSGMPMRAGTILEALAEHYDVFLWVPQHRNASSMPPLPRELAGMCARVHAQWVEGREESAYRNVSKDDPSSLLAAERASRRPFLCRYATAEVLREAAGLFQGIRFDAVHVSRLCMAPFVNDLLVARRSCRPFCVLDLDDLESDSREQIASLYERAGEDVFAAIERLEAEKYARMQEAYVPLFDEVWVCSDRDREQVQNRYRHRGVVVMPNVVRLPEHHGDRSPGGPFTLLFIGAFGYYPNEDAMRFFCSEILPRLRSRPARAIRVVIAGLASHERVADLAAHAEVDVVGRVANVAECYRQADLVVAPIRAGGGTRIKILEAFSYRRPVVATRIGAQGLDVRNGRELLLADFPPEFAEACRFLMENGEWAAALAERAFQWVTARHSLKVMRERLLLESRTVSW